MAVKRSRVLFLIIAILFFGGLFYISYDISTRTTFPGSKSQLKERLKKQYLKPDSLPKDSSNSIHRP